MEFRDLVAGYWFLAVHKIIMKVLIGDQGIRFLESMQAGAWLKKVRVAIIRWL